MNCPFCEKEMTKGTLSGDGRTKVRWDADGEKIGLFDKMFIGLVDAEYTFTKFRIKSFYCENCKKMIFDTNLSK